MLLTEIIFNYSNFLVKSRDGVNSGGGGDGVDGVDGGDGGGGRGGRRSGSSKLDPVNKEISDKEARIRLGDVKKLLEYDRERHDTPPTLGRDIYKIYDFARDNQNASNIDKLKEEKSDFRYKKNLSRLVTSLSLVLIIVLSVSLLSVPPGGESILQSLQPDSTSATPTPDTAGTGTTPATTAATGTTPATTAETGTGATDKAATGTGAAAKAATGTGAAATTAKIASSISSSAGASAMIAYNFATIGLALPFLSLIISAGMALRYSKQEQNADRKLKIANQLKSDLVDFKNEIYNVSEKNKEDEEINYSGIEHSIEKISKHQDDYDKTSPSTTVTITGCMTSAVQSLKKYLGKER